MLQDGRGPPTQRSIGTSEDELPRGMDAANKEDSLFPKGLNWKEKQKAIMKLLFTIVRTPPPPLDLTGHITPDSSRWYINGHISVCF